MPMPRSTLLLLAALSAAVAKRTKVIIPGWPDLPYPFSEGILQCDGCPTAPCALKVSGMQGFDFTQNPPSRVGGGVANETKVTMQDIAEVVKATGATMDDVTACQVWLKDIADFDAMNDVYKTFFSDPYPTRIAAGGFQLAEGAAVEIVCEATAPCK